MAALGETLQCLQLMKSIQVHFLKIRKNTFQQAFNFGIADEVKVALVVSDSVWPHGLQPTRLLRPRDSTGKNTGVGCRFLLQCMKVESESESLSRVLLLATPWTAAYQALPSMGFSRQEYWSGVPLPPPMGSWQRLPITAHLPLTFQVVFNLLEDLSS